MNLFQTLLSPDKEELENGERVLVGKAANILQVGEFQLLQLAYRDWHNKELPEALVSQLFSSYMLRNEVPHWARYFARNIIEASEKGALNDNEPSFHDFDHNYHTSVPGGLRRFWVAVGVLAVAMGGAIVLADLSIVKTGSSGIFPPYLDQNNLKISGTTTPYGRADVVPPSSQVDASLPDMGRESDVAGND
ncbi:MAG: hypothetical protein ISR45_09725 [Rhodospirillales bacterium]|nr:hypothetical protein [Rhodospirillales bacterium]